MGVTYQLTTNGDINSVTTGCWVENQQCSSGVSIKNAHEFEWYIVTCDLLKWTGITLKRIKIF